MATRAPFLTPPYGAYYQRDVPEGDEEYRQAWHQGRAKRPGPRARDVGGGAGHPDLLQPHRDTRPRGAYARS